MCLRIGERDRGSIFIFVCRKDGRRQLPRIGALLTPRRQWEAPAPSEGCRIALIPEGAIGRRRLMSPLPARPANCVFELICSCGICDCGARGLGLRNLLELSHSDALMLEARISPLAYCALEATGQLKIRANAVIQMFHRFVKRGVGAQRNCVGPRNRGSLFLFVSAPLLVPVVRGTSRGRRATSLFRTRSPVRGIFSRSFEA